MENLVPDPVWKSFDGGSSFQEFCSVWAKHFVLPNQLPDFLKEEFNTIKKLLQHAYFENKFIDVALLQSIILLEKTLKNRYEEIYNKPFKGIFQNLIKEFCDQKYFEPSNAKELLDIYRETRNKKAHDLDPPGGLLLISWIYRILFFVNDVYEDQNLREISQKEKILLQEELNSLLKEGAILEHKEKRLIIFAAQVMFINNKKRPSEITLAYWPIFDPVPYGDDDPLYTLSNYVIKITNPRFPNPDNFEAETCDGEYLKIDKFLNEANLEKYKSWQTQVAKLENAKLMIHFKNQDLNKFYPDIFNGFYSTPIPPIV